jgi:orotate phosphoribosyltransferase
MAHDDKAMTGEKRNETSHRLTEDDDAIISVGQLRDTINDKCIVRVPRGSKELPALNGEGYYTWQFYLRRVLLDADCLRLVCTDFWNKFEQRFRAEPFQLAGVESAAVPLITALIIDGAKRRLDVNAFTIRKNRKTYGLRNLIEGSPSGRPVLFVDDLTSPQHNAFWHAIHAISVAGLKLNGFGYVLVRKQKTLESREIETSLGKVTIDSLFTLSDFSMTLEDYAKESSGHLRQDLLISVKSEGRIASRNFPRPSDTC